MKKTLLFLVALLPMAVTAETYQQIYQAVQQPLSVEQIVSDQPVVSQIVAKYDEAIKEVIDENVRLNKLGAQNINEWKNFLASRSKSSQQQQQVNMEVTGDVMSMLAKAGISMDKLATMSEDEIMAALAPQMQSKTGLTPEEMQMFSKMNDQQIEAYAKAHPDVLARLQNSPYAQKYGFLQNELSGSNAAMLTAHDEQSVERIRVIVDEEIPVIVPNFTTDYHQQMQEETAINNTLKEAADLLPKYDEQSMAIMDEFLDRFVKTNPFEKATAVPAPSYMQSYVDRANAVIKEGNTAAVKMLEAKIQPMIDRDKAIVEKLLVKFNEIMKLYDGMDEDKGRWAVGQFIMRAEVYTYLLRYLQEEKKRLEVAQTDYYVMPKEIYQDANINIWK